MQNDAQSCRTQRIILYQVNMVDSEEKNQFSWYAMRDFTRPNAKMPAYKLLAQKGLEVFTPMKEQLIVQRGKRIRENVPVLHDLLFVHGQRDDIDPIVAKTETLQYRYKKGVQRTPITIEEEEMQRFIHAVRTSEQTKYYLPGELTPNMYGNQVHIIGGPLNNFDGKLLKLRGSKKKYLIVELDGLLSVGVEVSPEYITLV